MRGVVSRALTRRSSDMMKRPPFAATAITLAIAAALATGYANAKMPGVADADATSVATAAAPVARQNLPDFSQLVEQFGNAVVNVTVKKPGAEMAARMPDMDEDSPFGEFYRRFGPPKGEPGPTQPTRAVGSGFIVSSDGYILTNAHVVDGSQEVTVKLSDKREFGAKVVGVDSRSDVAVLKIEATDLPAVRI